MQRRKDWRGLGRDWQWGRKRRNKRRCSETWCTNTLWEGERTKGDREGELGVWVVGKRQEAEERKGGAMSG